MASNSLLPRGFQLGVLWRALLFAGLVVILIRLLTDTHFYATALVVILCGGLIVADLMRLIAHADRSTLRVLDSLAHGTLEAPATGSGLPAHLVHAFERARRQLQQDRQQQRQGAHYLQTLLDTVPAALLVTDAHGALRLVNRAAFRLFGEPVTQLNNLPSLGAQGAATLATLVPGAQQIVQLRDGRQLLASAALFTAAGELPQRLICLQRLVGELDAVEHKAWDDMTRVLAHEMMNSLTPIASLSQSLDALLRAGNRTEEVAGALEAIRRRSLGLMRFVERYRRVAELPEPLPQSLQIRQVLAGVERLMAPALATGSIRYSSAVTPQDLTVSADPDLLEQALINLLRNAAEAAGAEAGGSILVTCGLEEGTCFIDIADNGPGLAQEAYAQIFVPFFTTKPGGSGVGLSLARRIALGHGGQITLRPNQPRGSVFRFSLPA